MDAEAEKRQTEEFAAFAEYAKQQGLGWTLTVAHCGRRDFDKLIRGSNVAIANGAERIDLMDLTSTLSPEAMKLFTRTYRSPPPYPNNDAPSRRFRHGDSRHRCGGDRGRLA